jgi:hypothetical protein
MLFGGITTDKTTLCRCGAAGRDDHTNTRSLIHVRRAGTLAYTLRVSGLHRKEHNMTKNKGPGKRKVTSRTRRCAELATVAATGVAGPNTVDVVFDLDKSANAKIARVYPFDPNAGKQDMANNSGKPHGVLAGQKIGTRLKVVLDVTGDSTSVGAFNVTNAGPPSISLTAAKGPAVSSTSK